MTHDVCLVLLLFVVLANLETTISIHHSHPSMRVLSQNMSSSFTSADPVRIEASAESNLVQNYARYRADSPPAGGYTGGMATIDVYSHQYIKSEEVTAAIMWVSNGKTDQLSDLNDIQAGWAADGYKSTGCFNLDCNGFEPVNDAPITPGDILEPENGHSKISFKIFKNKDDGDWWLHFGYDINNLKPVGFWKKSIFTNLQDHAGFITWGGYTRSPNGNASPPMGNGQWPGKNSASVQNVQFVDSTGQGYALPAWALHVSISNKKCYQVSTFFDSMFYYGGPGGCTD
ncbi:embryo-sac basal-endosperm-layer embryo-surrounding-region 2 precursor [Zea mays]|uniref:ZmEBE-2 protein n=1 Tax=Zea mays TaxID=4577 RepID=Q84VQ8_MAIZE|nr:embryo-sac basal-endosperm-layer embryo-surrounding-region 2 precursor [Zea mays]CAD24798.1 ZmEBE-2 protein [Zea mays]|eukprot:NP_001105157.1 embryo-sac basal-endosperm-layer embryo-surrounding-region 2 precursor [Zea mays]